ncbi:MAG: ubiquinone/menaquinone biosynthesis C-methylase UbiE [Desulforhopalus sp.]|jgi:ubiquinone/menaquinone biosynthesis C-methylase UbiE
MKTALFDTWTEKYDSWFETPTGQYVRKYELAMLLKMLAPMEGDLILDAGCGTGVFTRDVINQGAEIIGMDISAPMLAKGARQMRGIRFSGVCGDMCALPFSDNSFDRVYSMTAIEFIPDAVLAMNELNRVAKIGACIVVTTLNSLSPWAERRIKKAKQGHSLFESIIFRSPDDMRLLIPEKSIVKTAIHFQKDEPVDNIAKIEEAGNIQQLETGAFLAAQWVKK